MLFIYLLVLLQVYWSLPLYTFVTFLCMRTTLTIDLLVKQLLRFSILGKINVSQNHKFL